MHRRQWLAVMMIVAGASLLIAASFASASTSSGKALKKGGIFRYGLVGASTQVDPQLAYVTTAWSIEYATAAKHDGTHAHGRPPLAASASSGRPPARR